MRKVTLLTAAVLCFGLVGAFGQMTTNSGIEFSISGDASVTFGTDLDEGYSGFSESTSSDLTWTFVAESTEEKGEGDVYGWIELANFKAEANAADGLTVTAPSVSAKINMGPAYIDLTTGGVSVNQASQGVKVGQNVLSAPSTTDVSGAWETEGGDTVGDQDVGAAAGGDLAFGINAGGMATVELSVGSSGDWDNNTNNAYILGFSTDLTPTDALTVNLDTNLRVNYNDGDPMDANNPVYVGTGLEYSLGAVAPDTDLVPFAGVDMELTDADTRTQVGAGVNLTWASLGTDDAETNVFGADANVTSGVGLGVTYYTAENASDLGVKLGFYEDDGDAGLLPGIGAATVLQFNQNLETEVSGLGIGLEANYTAGPAKPYFGVVANNSDLDAGDFGTSINAGLELTMIPNTTLTLDYASGNVALEGDGTGVGTNVYTDGAADAAQGNAKLGEFSITAKVAY